MITAGDICLANLNDESRRRVLVISNDRFHGVSGRALVAPEIVAETDEVLFPWRIQVDGATYAVDLVRSLPAIRLLDRTGRAPAAAMAAVRSALLNIT